MRRWGVSELGSLVEPAWLSLLAGAVFVFAAGWLWLLPLLLAPIFAGAVVALSLSSRRTPTGAGAVGAVAGFLGSIGALLYAGLPANLARIGAIPALNLDFPVEWGTEWLPAVFAGGIVAGLPDTPTQLIYAAVSVLLTAGAAFGLRMLLGREHAARLVMWCLAALLAVAFVYTSWTSAEAFRAELATPQASGSYRHDAAIFRQTYEEMRAGKPYYAALVAGAAGDQALIENHGVRDGRFYEWAHSPAFVRLPTVFLMWSLVPGGGSGVLLFAALVSAALLLLAVWAFTPYLGGRALVVPLLAFPLLLGYPQSLNLFFPDYWAGLALLASVLVVIRGRFVLAGAFALTAALMRDTATLWLVVLLGLSLVYLVRTRSREWFVRAAVLGVFVAAFFAAYAVHYHLASAIIAAKSAPGPSVGTMLLESAVRSFGRRFVAPASYMTYAYGFFQLPVWTLMIAQLVGFWAVLKKEPRVAALAFGASWLLVLVTVGATSDYWGMLFVPVAVVGTAALLARPEALVRGASAVVTHDDARADGPDDAIAETEDARDVAIASPLL